MKRPIPKSKTDSLLRLAAIRNRLELVERLLKEGADPNHADEEGTPLLYSVLNSVLWRYASPSADAQNRGLTGLELVLRAGAKWNPDERHVK